MPELERPPDELRALGRLAFGEPADAVGGLGAVHRAISDRVFRHVGPGGRADPFNATDCNTAGPDPTKFVRVAELQAFGAASRAQ